jgi:hypothetical protein
VSVYALHPGVINTEVGRHIKDSYGVLAAWLYKPFNALGELQCYFTSFMERKVREP